MIFERKLIELFMYGSSGLHAKEDEQLNRKNMIACSELVRLANADS